MKSHQSFIAAFGICILALNANANAQQVRADTGGIAIGGSVSNSTINIGLSQEKVDALVRDRTRPLEELTAQQKENITLLKEKLDLDERQVRRALDIVGEANVPPELLTAKLVEVAERYKVLLSGSEALPGDSPNVIALKGEAQKAIDAGELDKADALLARVETEQRLALDRLAVNAGETVARRGQIALTRLRYAEAATHFAQAAAVFPPGSAHEDKRLGYLEREAHALHQQGDEAGDNGALVLAIERWKQLISLRPRAQVPLEWARTQTDLANALFILGERESGTAKLDEAVAAYREALKENTRERVPLEWARTQMNLASALNILGERETGTAKLEEAVAAYREALKENTRERVPLAWAKTQMNLASALNFLGGRESGTAKLDEAVAAYREALKERTHERVPLEWAQTQMNLANVLSILGERESGTAKLEEAVVAYREVLKENTRERVPLAWAKTQANLAIALEDLGERESGTAKLEEAVAAYREALKENTRERVPLEWAWSLGNQGVALVLIAERNGNAAAAEIGVNEINTAYETLRDGGDSSAEYFEKQLPKARAVVARLSK